MVIQQRTTDSTHSSDPNGAATGLLPSREGSGVLRGSQATLAPLCFCRQCRARGLRPIAAQAQSKLEARYSVTLAGIPLGCGTWVIDIAADQYTAVANGRTSGLVKLISDGSGSGGSRGAIQGASVLSTGYVVEHGLRQEVPTKCA